MPGTPFLVEFFNDVRQQMNTEFGGGDGGWDIKIVDGGWDVDHAKASGIEVQLGCDVAENDAELSTMDDRVIFAVSVMAYMRSANVGEGPYLELLGAAQRLMVWVYRRAFEHVVDPPGSNAVAGTRMTPVIGDGPWGEADYTQQVMLVVFTANVVGGVSDAGGFLSPYPGPGPIRTILVEEEVSAEIDW